ncbi:unnamed protein product [Debaryomyces fabryi]|nr:unnamed protein product [Debaryomyces fabryi]
MTCVSFQTERIEYRSTFFIWAYRFSLVFTILYARTVDVKQDLFRLRRREWDTFTLSSNQCNRGYFLASIRKPLVHGNLIRFLSVEACRATSGSSGPIKATICWKPFP